MPLQRLYMRAHALYMRGLRTLTPLLQVLISGRAKTHARKSGLYLDTPSDGCVDAAAAVAARASNAGASVFVLLHQ